MTGAEGKVAKSIHAGSQGTMQVVATEATFLCGSDR